MGQVKKDTFNNALADCAGALTRLHLGSLIERDSSRFEPTHDLLLSAVWDPYWDLSVSEDAKEIELDLSEFISRIEGRVLTIVDSIFPPGSQCEAAKGLMRQRVWGIWHDTMKEAE